MPINIYPLADQIAFKTLSSIYCFHEPDILLNASPSVMEFYVRMLKQRQFPQRMHILSQFAGKVNLKLITF